MVSGVTSEFCLRLKENGHVDRYTLSKISRIKSGKLWIHIDEDNPESVNWLMNESGLDELVIENLLDEETQPRFFTLPTGTFVVLRDVNLNRNADVEDMIAVRFWIEKNRMISLSHRRQPAIEKLLASFSKGGAPLTPVGVFVRLSESITLNISKVLNKIDDSLDDIEDELIDVDTMQADSLRYRISDIRHQVLGMRRYIGPQKEVFLALKSFETDLNKQEKAIMRSIRRDMIQAVGALEYAREHSTVSQEELDSRINVQLNKTMYLLTIIMVVLAPLTLITGVLGSNSIEVTENPYGFLWISASLLILGILQVWYFNRKHWF